MLILLAIMAMVSVSTLQLGRIVHRRAAEEALLDAGAAFSDALGSYRRMTPAGRPDAPDSLEDLLKDPRFPGTVRHLRQLYTDPITGSNKWGIDRVADSTGIRGVYSLSEAHPIKVANFDARFQDFAGKTSYQQWEFVAATDLSGGNAASSGSSTLTRPLDLLDGPEAAAANKPATAVKAPDPAGPVLIRPLDLN